MVEVWHRGQDILGEGPVWHSSEDALYWLDIKGKKLQRRTLSGQYNSWSLPERASALAFQDKGVLLLATESGLYDYALSTNTMTRRVSLEPELPHNRSNEGKCDPWGNFWCGTMDDTEQQKSGALYRYTPNGEWTKQLDGIGISNTLAWSPDGTTMYFADSLEQTMYAFDIEPESGKLTNQRIFLSTKGTQATPDGSAMDAEGHLWNCQWDGGKVVRYAPDGSVKQVIELPVSRPTSCAFGGKEMKTLFITSASVGLSEVRQQQEPLAGAVFTVEVAIRGAEIPAFI